MTRQFFIERVLRQVYGGFPTDDSAITVNLVNTYLNDAIAVAAKQNYKESIQLDGVGYVNNSFYSIFKGLSISKDETFLWQITLPQIPVGIGQNEGVSNLIFKSSDGQLSFNGVPLSVNQHTFSRSMRPIPNKILYYPLGLYLYAISSINLAQYTASVTMISGGDSTNLSSTLNIPDDFVPIVVEYLKQQLGFEKAQAQDSSNDGVDDK